MTKEKRKKILIDPAVQGAVLRRILVHWLYFVLVGFLAIVILQVITHGIDRPLTEHLTHAWQRFGVLGVVILCFLPAFIYDSVKLSHRFTGPIYRLRLTLREIADGRHAKDIYFREDDYWQEIARDVNRISARLRDLESDQRRQEEREEVPAEVLS